MQGSDAGTGSPDLKVSAIATSVALAMRKSPVRGPERNQVVGKADAPVLLQFQCGQAATLPTIFHAAWRHTRSLWS